MVNADSDLARAHPDWTLATEGYEPIVGRNQLVLDLARPEAFDHVLGQLDALLRDHDIAFVKWDMNRAHAQGAGVDGAAGTHRADLGAVRAARRTAVSSSRRRVRVVCERWWSGRSRDPATDRTGLDERLQRRAGASADPARRVDADPARVDGCTHRSRLARTRPDGSTRWRSGERRRCSVISASNGTSPGSTTTAAPSCARSSRSTRRIETCCTAATWCASTPARTPISPTACTPPTGRRAIVSFVQMATAPSLTPPPLRLPGLDPDRRYDDRPPAATRRALGHGDRAAGVARPTAGCVLTGRQLAVHGIQPPILHPESAILLTLTVAEPATLGA